MENMSPEMAVQLHQAHRAQCPHLVFFISRSFDLKFYAYYAQRQGNELIADKMVCRELMCGEWKQSHEVPAMLLDSFFGNKTTLVPNTHTYVSRINALPEREMILHLKKNTAPTSNDGHVTAEGSLEIAPGIVVHKAQIINIHMKMTFNELEIPDVSEVRVHACTRIENVQHVPKEVFLRCCKKISDTQVLVTEIIPVTDQLKKRFDAATLTKKFFSSLTK